MWNMLDFFFWLPRINNSGSCFYHSIENWISFHLQNQRLPQHIQMNNVTSIKILIGLFRDLSTDSFSRKMNLFHNFAPRCLCKTSLISKPSWYSVQRLNLIKKLLKFGELEKEVRIILPYSHFLKSSFRNRYCHLSGFSLNNDIYKIISRYTY